MQRIQRRWATPFGTWVSRYTVPGITQQLATAGHPINDRTVYDWLAGRSTPRLHHATALVRISNGELRIEDIVSQRAQARTGTAR